MNLNHILTFMWLRWRLLVNAIKRAGTANAVIAAVLVVIALVASLVLFVSGLALGAVGLPQMPAQVRLFVWVGIIALFSFFWLIGMLAAMQRSESLSLDKVLFLPVSPSGAFLVNYLSSFLSLTLILFVPGMIGLAIGDVYSTGAVLLLAFPLLFSFIFACTALTYQFQGWLASMVSNPRRRRTIIVVLTAGIFVLVQVPNLINVLRPWEKAHDHLEPGNNEQMLKLNKRFEAGEITGKQYAKQKQLLEKEALKERDEAMDVVVETVESTTRLVCGVLPPGWVALGIADLANGHIVVSLLGTLGLGLIGSLALLRAYRTTIRMYTQGGSGEIRAAKETTKKEPADERPRLMERKLPVISEYASGVALAGFRSLLRAPEAKMLLLTPMVMLIVFGGGFASATREVQPFGPFVVISMVGMMLVSMMQFVGNTFGFDRDGFRVFVLGPIPRREILLGKNLTMAPLILGLGFIVVTGAGFVVHLHWDQFLAAYFQIMTMYLLFSLLGNLCSIYAPFMIPSGSLKGARPRMVVVLAQICCMMCSPFVIGLPTVFPSILELALTQNDLAKGWPVSLGVSILMLAASLWCYTRIITWEGILLAGREQRILEAVTKPAD